MWGEALLLPPSQSKPPFSPRTSAHPRKAGLAQMSPQIMTHEPLSCSMDPSLVRMWSGLVTPIIGTQAQVTGLPPGLAGAPAGSPWGSRHLATAADRTLGWARASPECPPSDCGSQLGPGHGKESVGNKIRDPELLSQGKSCPREPTGDLGMPVGPGGSQQPSPWSARVWGFRRPMLEDRAGGRGQVMSAWPLRFGREQEGPLHGPMPESQG